MEVTDRRRPVVIVYSLVDSQWHLGGWDQHKPACWLEGVAAKVDAISFAYVEGYHTPFCEICYPMLVLQIMKGNT